MARTIDAMRAGRARWLERMRAAKAAGLIERIPGGKPRSSSGPGGGRVVNAARAVVVELEVNLRIKPVAAEIPNALEATEPPWECQSNSERLNTLTRQSLGVIKQILDAPDEPGNLKLMSIKKDAALSVVSAQIKVDETRLRARDESRLMAKLDERIRAAKSDLLKMRTIREDGVEDVI